MKDETSEIVRIPHERVRILIGRDDRTRKLIQSKCSVTLSVERDGEVEISGDATDVFFAMDVIRAIGRGFEPSDALKLIGHDYVFYLIPLKEVIGSDKAITRLKGRVIGEKGRIKEDIEDSTDSIVCIYGNTIGIISKMDTMESAKEAIGMLLDGAPHAVVTAFLAKTKRRIMEERLRSSA